MPRPKNTIDKNQIKLLKEVASQTFGKPMNYSFECETMSKEIKQSTGIYISPQTLRRLFGFLHAEFSPSAKTLNALASYCGFVNYHSFCERSLSLDYQPLTPDQEAEFYLNFYKIEMKEERDMNYHNASRNIALRILRNPALLSMLSSSLAKNPVSQIYFFERFPYIDGLGSDYKRSIHLYLQKKDEDAQIFGNSLLFLSAFLCEKHKELKTYHERLNNFTLTEKAHPFIAARFIGSNILYSRYKNEDVSKWLEQVSKWNKLFLSKSSSSMWHYPYFQHMMTDYLNLAGMFEESYKIVRTKGLMSKTYEIETGYEEALQVIDQIASHRIAPEIYVEWMRSTDTFCNVNPLFSKFMEMQALCAYRSLLTQTSKKTRINLRIDELVRQTGFTYFNSYLQ